MVLAATEERVTGLAAPNVSALRATAYYSLFPAGLADGYVPGVRRFRDPAWPPLSRYVGRPFAYVSFGSVAGGMAEPAGVHTAAIAAVAGLDADVLLTVGRGADPVTPGPPPRNVRIERWADQSDVLGRAAAVVCHGGGGTTLGALAAGVPLVLVPSFASDQHVNARRVTEVGAGRTATPTPRRSGRRWRRCSPTRAAGAGRRRWPPSWPGGRAPTRSHPERFRWERLTGKNWPSRV